MSCKVLRKKAFSIVLFKRKFKRKRGRKLRENMSQNYLHFSFLCLEKMREILFNFTTEWNYGRRVEGVWDKFFIKILNLFLINYFSFYIFFFVILKPNNKENPIFIIKCW